MRSIFTFLLSLSFASTFAQQPIFEWGNRIGGNEVEMLMDIAADAFGNSYAVGAYDSDVAYWGATSLTAPPNVANGYVAKYNAAGQLAWVRSIVGAHAQSIYAVSCDAAGNVYVAGEFRSTSIAIGNIMLTNAGALYTSDIFVAKYDSSGNVMWAKSFGGPGNELPEKMAVTSEGKIVVCGYYKSDLPFGNTTLANAGFDDAFYALLDADGNLVLANSIGGSGYEKIVSVLKDTSGGFYLSGHFSSPQVNLDGNTMTSFGDNDIFLARFDANGNLLWNRQYGGTGSDELPFLAADPGTGDVLLFARVRSANCAFGGILLQNPSRIVLARISPDGATLMAKNLIGPITTTADIAPSAIAIDGNRNIYISGTSLGAHDFEGMTLNHTPPLFGHFLVKYSAEGMVQWGKISGTINAYISNHLASNGTDTVFFGGYFASSSINFDAVTVTNTNAYWDVFLTKFINPTLDVDTFGVQTKTIYPNPVTNTLFLDRLALDGNQQFRVTDMAGRTVRQGIIAESQNLNVEMLAKGAYVLWIDGYTFRFLKQ